MSGMQVREGYWSVLGAKARASVAWLLGVVIIASLGATASAQQNVIQYELRIRSLDPDLVSGGGVIIPTTGRTVRFVVEGRSQAVSLAPGNTHYGLGRLSVGPTGSGVAAQIRLVDSAGASRLRRGEVAPSGPGGFPLTGRAPLYRTGGPVSDTVASPWHSTDVNGTNNGLFPSGANNQFGAFDLDNDRIYGFDSYLGPARQGVLNPWLVDFPVVPLGSFSPWKELYLFDAFLGPTIEPRIVTIQAEGFMAAAVRTQDIGGGNWLMSLASATNGAAGAIAPSFIFSAGRDTIPPPTFATLRTGTFAPPLGNGSQYRVVRASRPLAWFEARDYAESLGGLASVTSQAENAYIKQNLLRDLGDGAGVMLPWVGATRPAFPAPLLFSWLNQEIFSYTDWLPGEPSLPTSIPVGIAYGVDPTSGVLGWVDQDVIGSDVTDLLIEINPCISPGRIVTQTVDTGAVLQSGATVELEVVATGVTRFQWRRNGVAIPGATGTRLTFAATQATVGTYDCFLQDACSGLVTQPVTVRICSDLLQPYSSQIGARARFGVATDPTSGRVMVFGGESLSAPRTVTGTTLLQTASGGWEQTSGGGQSPEARSDHAMSDGPLGPTVFGGRNQAGAVLGDAWVFRNNLWQPLAFGGDGPIARTAGVMAFDRRSGQAVLFGGRDAAGIALGDTWLLNAGNWRRVEVPDGQGPQPRWNHAMAYDPSREGIVLFGGRTGSGVLDDTWLLKNGRWTLLGVSGPTPREEMTLHVDAVDRSIRMVGGRSELGSLLTSEWRLDASGWTRVSTSFIYGPMYAHRALSTLTGQMFLAGGFVSSTDTRASTYAYSGPTNPAFGDLGDASVGFDAGGAPIVLEVTGTGSISLIRWARNGVPLADGPTTRGSVIAGSTTRRLTITNPTSFDAGSYTVTFSGACEARTSRPYIVSERCGLADVGVAGGVEGSDQRLDNNDFVVFVSWFFDQDRRADIASEGGAAGADGAFDSNDFVIFIQRFFAGCD
jgi:hypothetical protein